MACKCEFPLKAEEQMRSWSGKMTIHAYCGNCGEPFGAEHIGKRKKRKERNPDRWRPLERRKAKFPGLKRGDKFVVTKTHQKSLVEYGWGWYQNPQRERLVVGRTYRVVDVSHWWYGFRIEEFNVPNVRRFRVEPEQFEYTRVPDPWE